MKPKRIQRRRSKGWRLPPNTICVSSPGKWGNPYKIGDSHPVLAGCYITTAEFAVELYRRMMVLHRPQKLDLSEIRGKNLACWCKEGTPCHADILLELANK